MANRGTRAQSSEQKNEGQRREGQTSAESTSLTSATATTDRGELTVEQELQEIQEQSDSMLGKDTANEGKEKITVKTLGSYLVHDPTTGDTVESDGVATEVVKSQFIKDQIASGRLAEA